MINLLKSFYRSHRGGGSAGKMLLWIWVKEDLPKIKGELGVDLAGGTMGNKHFFSTEKYICVDIDQKELDEGKNRNPDAIIINSRMQEYLRNDDQKKPDVLVCFQTMGTNEYFEHDESVEVIKSMYNFLKPGGSMIFNIVWLKNINDIEKQLSSFFEKKFESVNFKYYGALHKTWKNPMPGSGLIRFLLAYLMHLLPPLRTFFGFKKERLYYCCKNKL